MVLRFFFFDNMRLNFIVYFAATTLVLMLGPEKFIPGLKKSKEASQIDAPCGSMIGVITHSRKGRTIDAYKGIPYAKPPVGQRRFGRPEPFEDPAWDGVRESKSEGNTCYQSASHLPFIGAHGDEDCLVLNVYRPAGIDKGANLPVMVWFHGGGFVTGSSDAWIYGPGALLDRDVILVTANYRLGVLGYLTLGKSGEDVDLQGNQGLWDQVEVLKWVRKNVRSFGGDPKHVTIFGESAGGMSVSYHLLSKASRGLFQAAIVQSGPIYAPFVKGDYNRPLVDLHREFVAAVGCPLDPDNVESTAKCLRSKTPAELASNMFMFDQCNLHEPDLMPFPAVWSHSDDSAYSSQPFFRASPYQEMKSDGAAKVPIMLGFTKEDGLLITAVLTKHPQLFAELRDNWEFCGPANMLGSFYSKPTRSTIELANRIRDFYVGKADFDLDEDFSNLTYMFTDAAFAIGTDMMARDLIGQGRENVFYYSFEHRGDLSLGDMFKATPLKLILLTLGQFVGIYMSDKMGTCHADDILYLFKNTEFPGGFAKGGIDERMVDTMVDLWTNFATFHDPTPSLELKEYLETELVSGADFRQMKWPHAGSNADKKPLYARLSNGEVKIEKDEYLERRLEFQYNYVVSHLFR